MKKFILLTTLLLSLGVRASAFLSENGMPNRETQLLAFAVVKHTEGSKTEVYDDGAGNATIGNGNRYYENGTEVQFGDAPMSLETAQKTSLNHLCKDAQSIRRNVKRELNRNQFIAVSLFVYASGPGTFQKSNLLTLLNSDTDDMYKIARAFGEFTGKKDKNGKSIVPGLYNTNWLRMILFLGKITPEQVEALPALAIYGKGPSFFYKDSAFTVPDLSDEKVQEFLDYCSTIPSGRIKTKIKVKEVVVEQSEEGYTTKEIVEIVAKDPKTNYTPEIMLYFNGLSKNAVFATAYDNYKVVSYYDSEVEVEVDSEDLLEFIHMTNSVVKINEEGNIQIEIIIIRKNQPIKEPDTKYVTLPRFVWFFENDNLSRLIIETVDIKDKPLYPEQKDINFCSIGFDDGIIYQNLNIKKKKVQFRE